MFTDSPCRQLHMLWYRKNQLSHDGTFDSLRRAPAVIQFSNVWLSGNIRGTLQ